MSEVEMVFGSFIVALSVGISYEFISPMAGVVVGFGTLAAIVIDVCSLTTDTDNSE